MDKEDPVQLLEIFQDKSWKNKDDIIRDITNKLREFGYITEVITDKEENNEYNINFSCEHGVVCGHFWIYEDCDDGYICDMSYRDINNDLNECQICKMVKTIKISDYKTINNNDKTINDNDKIILDKKTVEEIIKLIESEEYMIVNDEDIIISEEEGIVLTLKEILKGKNENYKLKS